MKIRIVVVMAFLLDAAFFINCATGPKNHMTASDEPLDYTGSTAEEEASAPERAPAGEAIKQNAKLVNEEPQKQSPAKTSFKEKKHTAMNAEPGKSTADAAIKTSGVKQESSAAGQKYEEPLKGTPVTSKHIFWVAWLVFFAVLILLFILLYYLMKKKAPITALINLKSGDKITFKRAGEEIAAWYYQPDGSVKKHGERLKGRVELVADEGFARFSAAVLEFVNNRIKYGMYPFYYGGGILKEEITFTDDFKHGPFRIYYTNGKIKLEGNYEKNIPSGVIKEYYETGALKGAWIYESGNLSEVYRYYPKEIILMEEWKYVKGMLHGMAKEYYETRGIKAEVPYVYGKIHGTLKEYYENSVIKEVSEYREGKEIRTKIFDENGREV